MLKYWLVIVISLLMDLAVIMLTPVALLTSTKLNQTIDLLLKIDSVFWHLLGVELDKVSDSVPTTSMQILSSHENDFAEVCLLMKPVFLLPNPRSGYLIFKTIF